VFQALAYVHAYLLRVCLWLLRLPFRALWWTILGVVALVGEVLRRWAGVAVSGLLIVLAGKATLSFAPPDLKRPLVLALLVLVVLWALAVKRAAHLTKENNLIKVRQRQAFRELKGDVRDLRGEAIEGMARATRDTPIGGVFGSNRQRRDKEAANARAAAEQAAEQAEANRQAAAERDRRLDELTALEPNPYETQAR
jgi:signal transduction histidine kinase